MSNETEFTIPTYLQNPGASAPSLSKAERVEQASQRKKENLKQIEDPFRFVEQARQDALLGPSRANRIIGERIRAAEQREQESSPFKRAQNWLRESNLPKNNPLYAATDFAFGAVEPIAGLSDYDEYAAAGAVRNVGHLKALPSTVASAIARANVPEESWDVINRQRQYDNAQEAANQQRKNIQQEVNWGGMSAQDAARALQQVDEYSARFAAPTAEETAHLDDARGRSTIRQSYDKGEQFDKIARNINSMYEGASEAQLDHVTKAPRNELMDDIGVAFDDSREDFKEGTRAVERGDYGQAAKDWAWGAAKLLANAPGVVLSNPKAVSQFLAENAPQLFGGMVSKGVMGVANIGYGLDVYQDAMEDFAAKNNGALPSKNEQLGKLALGLTAGILDQVGDLGLLKVAKGTLGKAATEAAAKAAAGKGTRDTAKALIAGTGRVATASGREFLTEGIQTAIEEDFSKGKSWKDLSGEAIYGGAVIGGGVGKQMSLAGEAGRVANNKSVRKAADMQANLGRKRELAEAVKTGDMTAAMDVSHAKYDLSQSMDALARRSGVEAVTDTEKQQLQAQGQQLIMDSINQTTAMSNKVIKLTEEGAPAKEIAKAKQEQARLEAQQDTAIERFKVLKNAVTPVVKATNEQNMAVVAEAESKPEDAAVQQQAAEAVSSLVQSEIVNPGTLTDEQMEKVTTSELVPLAQRTHMAERRETVRLTNDATTLPMVEKEVLIGGGKKPGLRDYQERVGNAIAVGDVEGAKTQLDQLARFAATHTTKLAAIEAAWAPFEHAKANNIPYNQVVRTPEQQVAYDHVAANYFQKELRNGKKVSLDIGRAAGPIVEAVRAEAAALQAGQKDLQTLIDNTAAAAKAPAQEQAATPAPQAAPKTETQAKAPVKEALAEKTSESVTPPAPPQAQQKESSPSASQADMSTYVNHSGGATGSDSAWDEVGREYGVTDHRHYQKGKTPLGNTTITEEQFKEGLGKAKQAANDLGRRWSDKSYVQGLLSRNWQQVKNSDAVFAIAARLTGPYVSGGTGYAVAMAIREGKPVFAFDQSQNQWFQSVDGQWQATDTPTLTPNFAGIGTRELTGTGREAIRDVYAKTQTKAAPAEVVAEPEVATPPPVTPAAEETRQEAGSLKEPSYPNSDTAPEQVAKEFGEVTNFNEARTFVAKYAPDLLPLLDPLMGKAGFMDTPIKVSDAIVTPGRMQYSFDRKTRERTPGSQEVLINPDVALQALTDGRILSDIPFSAYLAEVLVHEGNHAATFIEADGELKQRLMDIQRGLSRWRSKNKASLSRQELKILKEMEYQPDELLAWTWANPIARNILRRVPTTKGGTLFSEFVDMLQQFLGLPASHRSMLTDVLEVMDDILKADPAYVPPASHKTETQQEEQLEEEQDEDVEPENTLSEEPDPAYDLSAKLQQVPADDPDPKWHLGNFLRTKSKTVLHQVDQLNRRLREQGPAVLEKVLGRALSDKQSQVAREYADLSQDLERSFYELFLPKERGYYHENYLNYLLDPETGELDPNVMAAITASIYNWANTSAGDTVVNDVKAMNNMIGRSPSAPEPARWIKDILKYGGVHQAVLANQLGRNVVSSLGAGFTSNMPENMEARFVTDMGNMMITMMAENGLLTQKVIEPDVVAKIVAQKNDEGFDEETDAPPVVYELDKDGNVKLDKKGNPIPKVERVSWSLWRVPTEMVKLESGNEFPRMTGRAAEIVATNRETEGFFQDLFSMATRRVFPSTQKPKPWAERKENQNEDGSIKPRTMKGTTQTVPTEVAEAMDIHEQRAHSLNTDTDSVFYFLDRKVQEAVVGMVDLDQNPQHVDLLDSVVGTNSSLTKELDDYNEFREVLMQKSTGPQTPFYFQHEAWKQMRLGMLGNTVNPQSSKFHRSMVKMNDWVVDIPLGDPDNKVMEQFHLAVAAALGVKTDKNNVTDSLTKAREKLADPEIRAAIDAIKVILDPQSRISEQSVQDMQAAIAAGVKAGGEKTHSLQGLTEQARLELAQEAEGQETFTTSITPEIDGVTNGPAMGLLQFMAKEDLSELEGLLNKAGIFFDGETTSYGDWLKHPDSLDNYQSLAKDWGRTLSAFSENYQKGDRNRVGMAAIATIFRPMLKSMGDDVVLVTSDGRKLAKQPLMTMVYGSGAKALKAELADAFINEVLTQITKAANTQYPGMDQQQQEAARLEVINQLVKIVNYATGDPKVQVFAPFTTVQEALETKMDWKGEQRIRAMVENTYGETVWDTVQSQFKEFIDRRTTVNNAITATFYMFKATYDHEVAKREQELIAAGELRNGDTLPKAEEQVIRKQLLQMQPLMHSYFSARDEALESALYLGKNAMQTRSDDRRYQSKTSLKRPMRLVTHEGQVMIGRKSLTSYGRSRVDTAPGVGSTILAIHSLDGANKAGIYAKYGVLGVHDGYYIGLHQAVEGGQLLNSDFFDIHYDYSIAEQAEATLLRAAASFKTYMRDNNVDLLPKVKQAMAADKFKKTPDKAAEEVGNTRRIVDEQKRDFMDRITYLVQFNIEGGGHAREVSQEVLAARRAANPKAAPTAWEMGEELSPEEAAKWPVNAAARQLLSSGQPVTTLDLLKASWMGNKGAKTGIEKAMQLLIEAMGKQLVNDTTQIILVKPDSVFPDMDADMVTEIRRSRAVYDAPNGKLYLKADGFNKHGLSTETLVHELLHIATTRALRQGTGAQIEAARANLEALRGKLAARDQKAGGKFSEQLKNVDEMVAWGFTNPEFQAWLQSQEVRPKKAGRVQAVTTAFRALADNLLAVLTGRNIASVTAITALEELIVTTSAVLEVAATAQPMTDAKLEPLAQAANNPELDSETIFDKLGQIAPGRMASRHLAHLQQVLSDVVVKAQGPMGAKVRQYRGQMDVADQFLQAMADKDGHVLSRVLGAGFNLSAQEAYVYEQVEAVTRATLATHAVAARELGQLHTRVKGYLENLPVDQKLAMFATPGIDLKDPANAGYVTEAQRRYDLVFSPQTVQTETLYDDMAGRNVTRNRADYLHHFLALGTTHAGMRDVLEQISGRVDQPSFRGGTLLQKLEWIMRQLLNRLVDWELGTTKTGNAQQRLDTLARQLAGIDNRKEAVIIRHAGATMDKVTGTLDKGATVLRKGIQKVANSERVKNSKLSVVKAAGTAVNSLTDSAFGNEVTDNLQTVMNRINKGQQGILGSLTDEMRGMREGNKLFYRMLRRVKNQLEKGRQQVTDWTHKQVNQAFITPMTEAQAIALNKAGLKTELFQLLEEGNIAALDPLLRDPTARAARLQQLETELQGMLPKGANINYLTNPADFLGHFMATGEVRSENMQFNAHAIAQMRGIDAKVKPTAAQAAKMVPVLQKMATLHALNYTAQQHLDQLSEVLRAENQRMDGEHGLVFTLNLHKELQQQALEHAFGNDPSQMIMGFTVEVTNQNIGTEVAFQSDAAELAARGYVPHHPIGRDSNDPDGTPRVLYVSQEGGMPRRVSGIAVMSGQVAKGSRSGDNLTRQEVADLAAKTSKKQARTFSRRVSPLSMSGVRMAPVQSPDGKVTSWRYMMSEAHKDDILQKRNDGAEVLGAMAGKLVEKRERGPTMDALIQAFHEEFMAGYARHPENYLEISATSSDPQLREIWAMLPPSAKHSVKQTWGREQMYVRKDLLNIGFGYRKWTISEIWEQEGTGTIRKAAHKMAISMLSPAAQRRVKMADRAILEGVALAKDFIVIRSVGVLVGNVMSNMTVLKVAGVPLLKMMAYQREGYIAIQDLMRDEEELFEAQQQLKLGANQSAAQRARLAQRIAALENSIATNPAKELVDAGLFPSIIEDVEQDRDPFSFQSRWMETLDKKTERLPKAAKEVVNLVMMGRNTGAYRFLSRTTQISDFVARYALHKHMVTRSAEPMSRQDSLDFASDAFVNYDIPSHRGIQAANDYGLLIFTRYYLRIQKVILRLLRDNPGQFALVAMMQDFLNISSMMDSNMVTNSIFNRFSNPVGLMWDAPGEIATLDLAGDMF